MNASWTKAAIAELMQVWPRAVPVEVLCEMALSRVETRLTTTEVDARRSLMFDLLQCSVSGLLELHAYQPNVAPLSEHPRVNALAAHQALGGSTVVNPRHNIIQVDDLEYRSASGGRIAHTRRHPRESCAAGGGWKVDCGCRQSVRDQPGTAAIRSFSNAGQCPHAPRAGVAFRGPVSRSQRLKLRRYMAGFAVAVCMTFKGECY